MEIWRDREWIMLPMRLVVWKDKQGLEAMTPKFGDTLPSTCPKCEAFKFTFVGYHRVLDENVWRCGRCGYDHYERSMDARRRRAPNSTCFDLEITTLNVVREKT